MKELRRIAYLEGHSDRVWYVTEHPDLPLFASCSADKTVRLWSSRSFKLIATLEGDQKRSIRSAAWKPSRGEKGPLLASASFDGSVGIWDEGDEGSWDCLAMLDGHENEAKGVAWSSNGTLLASCSRDKSVWVWEAGDDYNDFECLAVLQEHSQDVKCVAWHPSEELLASGSYDDCIRLWREDQDDWACCCLLESQHGTVWSIAFDPASAQDGTSRFASATDDGSVCIWRRLQQGNSTTTSNTASMPSTLKSTTLEEHWLLESILPSVHIGPVYCVAWSKKTGHIASAGSDGNVAVYTEGTKQWRILACKQDIHSVYEVNSVCFLNNSDDDLKELLVTGADDGKVAVSICN